MGRMIPNKTLIIDLGTISLTFTTHRNAYFAIRSKSISQSLRRVVRNRTFVQEKLTTRRTLRCVQSGRKVTMGLEDNTRRKV